MFLGRNKSRKKVIIEIIQNIDKLESRYELNRLTKNGLHITFVDIETIKVYNGGMRGRAKAREWQREHQTIFP